MVDVELELRSDGVTPTPPGRTRPERPSWRERRQHLQPRDRRMRRRGLLFVSPWLIGLSLFYVIPLGASLVLSFTDYELVDQDDKPTEFIGLDNWTRLFEDPEVRHSAWVTLKFAVVFLPLSIFLPLALAYLLTSRHLLGPSHLPRRSSTCRRSCRSSPPRSCGRATSTTRPAG